MLLKLSLIINLSCCVGLAPFESSAEIDSVIDRLDLRAGGEPYQTAKELRRFPLNEVVQVMASRLEQDARFQEPRLRRLAYSILNELQAERVPEGVNVFMRSLKEGYGPQGLGRLARLGVDARPEVIEALCERLRQDDPPNRTVMVSLMAYKERAGACLDDFIKMFHRPDLDWRDRGGAAKGVLAIAGIERTMELLLNENGDPEIERIARNILTLWIVQAEYSSPPDESRRRVVQKRVLAGLKDQDREVRIEAMQLMFGAFKHDSLVQDAEGKWIINPELWKPLEDVAANDPDPELRERAQQTIDDKETLTSNGISNLGKIRQP